MARAHEPGQACVAGALPVEICPYRDDDQHAVLAIEGCARDHFDEAVALVVRRLGEHLLELIDDQDQPHSA